MNNMLFLGDSGMPIPDVPSALPITYPNVNKVNFDPPGYAQRPPSTLGPIPIKHVPNSLGIKSPQELQAQSVSPLEQMLEVVRPQVSDIYGLLQDMPGAAEREMTIKVTLDSLRPGSDQRVKVLSDRLIAAGLPAPSAFREALSREIAATLLTGVSLAESAAGIRGLNEYFPSYADDEDEVMAGLGGIGDFFKKVYRGAKKAAKKAVSIVKKGVGYVAGVIKNIACSETVSDIAGGVSTVIVGNAKAGKKGVKSVCDQAGYIKDTVSGKKPKAKTAAKSAPTADELRRRETEKRLALLERQGMNRQYAPTPPPSVIIQAPAQPQTKQANVGLYAVLGVGALAAVLIATRAR
jgi:hypothetical protein